MKILVELLVVDHQRLFTLCKNLFMDLFGIHEGLPALPIPPIKTSASGGSVPHVALTHQQPHAQSYYRWTGGAGGAGLSGLPKAHRNPRGVHMSGLRNAGVRSVRERPADALWCRVL